MPEEMQYDVLNVLAESSNWSQRNEDVSKIINKPLLGPIF